MGTVADRFKDAGLRALVASAGGFWSLVILPPPACLRPDTSSSPSAHDGPRRPLLGTGLDACDRSAERRARRDPRASRTRSRRRRLLERVRHAVSRSRPVRFASSRGVRFAQRRWKDAAALARDALRHEPTDEYALDVLGSSLFMQDDRRRRASGLESDRQAAGEPRSH